MKKIKLMTTIMVYAVFAMLCNNGCLTTEKTIKEPTIKSSPETTEVVIEDIEVIERNDTTGRVSAAKEAARKLIVDAKRQSIELTRDAKNIYELKKIEAEKNAERIIADARKQAVKEKSALLKAYAQEHKKVIDTKTKGSVDKSKTDFSNMKKTVSMEVTKILKKRKRQTDKIAEKIIQNARKSASDITTSFYKTSAKIKRDADKILSDAKKYANAKKAEANQYLTKKMAEADKAVDKFTADMEKETPKKPKTKEEKTATAILDRMLKSIPKDDYATFSTDCTVDFKKRFNEKTFLATNKVLNEKLGPCKKTEYLGFLRKGPLTLYLWKASFEKTHKENELIIRLMLGDLDKKLQVFAFDISFQ